MIPVSEVFKGWRRKAGLIVLLLAVILIGGWFRSKVAEDSVRLSMPGGVDLYVTSFADKFHMTINRRQHVWNEQFHWYSEPIGERPAYFAQKGQDWIRPPIPYWQIVIPLTILSAYMILWPGKRKSAKPIQNSPPTSDLQS